MRQRERVPVTAFLVLWSSTAPSANRMPLTKGLLLYLVCLKHFREIKCPSRMWLVRRGCVWCCWALRQWLSRPSVLPVLPSPAAGFIVLPVGFCSSVLALVFLQSFLSLNLISEISDVLLLHLIMALKCVLPALLPLNKPPHLYIWMTHRHLKLIISRLAFISFPAAFQLPTSHFVFLSQLQAPKPFSLLSLQLLSFGALGVIQKPPALHWLGGPGGTALLPPSGQLGNWELGILAAGFLSRTLATLLPGVQGYFQLCVIWLPGLMFLLPLAYC